MRYIGLYGNVCRFRDSKETEKQKNKKKERLADMRMRDAERTGGGERFQCTFANWASTIL
jgi:hypothetical protein